jgi:hypothetical protein
MKTMTVMLILAGLATPAAPQARTDFSGRWTTDPVPAATPGTPPEGGGRAGGGRGSPPSLGSGWGSTIAINQDSSKLIVEYAFFGRGDMQAPIRLIYALDGSPTENAVMMGRGIQKQLSRAVWEAGSLSIVSTSSIPDPSGGKTPLTVDVKQVLSVDMGSFIVETTRPGILGGKPTVTRTVYRKITGGG